MERRTRFTIAGVVAVAALGTAAGVGVANTGDDQPLEGATYDQAVAAATAEFEGEVVETEIGDDGAAYEVEIEQPDGTVVEVELDSDFAVIGSEIDDDEDGEEDDD